MGVRELKETVTEAGGVPSIEKAELRQQAAAVIKARAVLRNPRAAPAPARTSPRAATKMPAAKVPGASPRAPRGSGPPAKVPAPAARPGGENLRRRMERWKWITSNVPDFERLVLGCIDAVFCK